MRLAPLIIALPWLLAACDDGGGGGTSARQEAPRPDAGALDAATAPDAVPADAAADAAPADAAPPDATADWGPPPTVAECFQQFGGAVGPQYAPFNPVLGHHCLGTNHQDVRDVERVVFLGDSVTFGTPPTQTWENYRWLVTEGLRARFGPDLEVESCAKLGARNDDFLRDGGQIPACFPTGGSEKRTLVIFTMGGNDIAAWAGDRESPARARELADAAAADLDAAVAWLKDPARFPRGSFVIFANPYEFTDATGDLESCALARTAGFEGSWIEGEDAVIHFNEQYMATAVRHQADLIFTLEAFCGHGFHHDDPESRCYRGPDTEIWFDLTCIHPNPTGHRAIADMVLAVVDE